MKFFIVFMGLVLSVQHSSVMASTLDESDLLDPVASSAVAVIRDPDSQREGQRCMDTIGLYKQHLKANNLLAASQVLIEYSTPIDELQRKVDLLLYDFLAQCLRDKVALQNTKEILEKVARSSDKNIAMYAQKNLAMITQEKKFHITINLACECIKRGDLARATKVLIDHQENEPKNRAIRDQTLLQLSDIYRNKGNRTKEKEILDVLADSSDEKIAYQAIQNLIDLARPNESSSNFNLLIQYHLKALKLKKIGQKKRDKLKFDLSTVYFLYGKGFQILGYQEAQEYFLLGQEILHGISDSPSNAYEIYQRTLQFLVEQNQWAKILSHQKGGNIKDILKCCANSWQASLNGYNTTIKKVDGTGAEFEQLKKDALYLMAQYLEASFYKEADKLKVACLNHPALQKDEDFIATLKQTKTIECLDGKSRDAKKRIQRQEADYFTKIMGLCDQQRADQERKKAQTLKDEKTQAAKAAKRGKRKTKAAEKKARKALERETKKEQPEHNQDKSEQVKTPSRLQKARKALESVSNTVHIAAEVLRNPAQAVQRHALPQVFQSYKQVKIKEPTRQERLAQHAANPKQKLEERVSRKPMNSVERTRLEVEAQRAKKTVKKDVEPIYLEAEKRGEWEDVRAAAKRLKRKKVIKFSEMQDFLKVLKRLGLLSEDSTPGKMTVNNVLISGHPDHDPSNFQRAYARRIIKAFLEGPEIKFR